MSEVSEEELMRLLKKMSKEDVKNLDLINDLHRVNSQSLFNRTIKHYSKLTHWTWEELVNLISVQKFIAKEHNRLLSEQARDDHFADMDYLGFVEEMVYFYANRLRRKTEDTKELVTSLSVC